MKRSGKKGNFGIPYRCLVPKDVDGLLLAGRCISASTEAGIKGTVKCLHIGHAAGTAAAMAVAQHKSPRQINVAELRARLQKDGLLPKPS